jgi:hypothetical protein
MTMAGSLAHANERGATYRLRVKSPPLLYLASSFGHFIEVLNLSDPGAPKISMITTGVGSPNSLTIDRNGTLYLADGDGYVAEYAEGATSPDFSIPVTAAVGVAVATNLDVWVISSGEPPELRVYHPGKTKPYLTIVNSLFQSPAQIAFGAADNLYTADNVTGISMISAGTTMPQSLGLRELVECPSGVAVDKVHGDLFVSGCNSGAQRYRISRRKPQFGIDGDFDAVNIALGEYVGQPALFVPDDAMGQLFIYDEAGHELFSRPLDIGATAVAYKPPNV